MDQFRQAEISPINKRSIEIDGHRTSVSLEDAFWVELKKIAAISNVRTAELIATINRERKHPNLSSAIRVFVLHHYREQASDDLHHPTYSATRRAYWSSLTAVETLTNAGMVSRYNPGCSISRSAPKQELTKFGKGKD